MFHCIPASRPNNRIFCEERCVGKIDANIVEDYLFNHGWLVSSSGTEAVSRHSPCRLKENDTLQEPWSVSSRHDSADPCPPSTSATVGSTACNSQPGKATSLPRCASMLKLSTNGGEQVFMPNGPPSDSTNACAPRGSKNRSGAAPVPTLV